MLNRQVVGRRLDRLVGRMVPFDAVVAPQFKPGDAVTVYKPGHSEHGMTATVGRVITIEDYGGPRSRGPHAYYPDKQGWRSSDSALCGFGGALPDAMVERRQ